MKRTRIAFLSALAVFVGTMPHAAGAMFMKYTPTEKIRCLWTSSMNTKDLAKGLAKLKLEQMYGKHSKREWKALSILWGKESAWNYQADNPKSTAYGIAQILGTPRNSQIPYQVTKGLDYIKHRYGTPTRALAFHNRHGWY